ncbi:MAG: deoxyribonuclease IV [Planctomycetota bacterium]
MPRKTKTKTKPTAQTPAAPQEKPAPVPDKVPDPRPLGAHMSIAGGLHKALERGKELDCAIIQLFTKNNTRWQSDPLRELDLDLWAAARESTGVQPVMAHDSYLINLASPDDATFNRSVEAFADELGRCSALQIPFLVTHPGSHMGTGEPRGIERVCEGLSRAVDVAAAHEAKWASDLKRDSPFLTTVLIETTAGQGSNLGYRFEHIRDILAGVAQPERFAVCLDTCHVFAAGYDIRDDDGWAETMREFDAAVGLGFIRAFHVNDSVRACGTRVDRHADIGAGEIGEGAFRAMLHDERFRSTPMALETPKDNDGDRRNLATLRRLAAK